MLTLYDRIWYDHKLYSQLSDPAGKQAIEQLAATLQPIEVEIINDPDGRIMIDKSGYFYIDGFHPEVAKKITKVLRDGSGSL